MKPQFKKTMMDLVEWHTPILMVITETRLSGARAVEIIETLPFNGFVVADTIGFAGGDLVTMENRSSASGCLRVNRIGNSCHHTSKFSNLKLDDRCYLC